MNQRIETFINDFNKSWTQGEFESMTSLLHDKVIFVSPDLKTEIRGLNACLQTIKDYSANAKTKTFEVRNKKIHIWDETAMITLGYYVEYEMKNQSYKENGTEFWTLNKQNGNWKLVWRALVKNEKIK